MSLRASLVLALVFAYGCTGHAGTPPVPTTGNLANAASHAKRHKDLSSIQHVVFIIQENRSFDNMFMDFPGANTQKWGMTKNGGIVKLQQVPINQGFDPPHGHTTFQMEADYDPVQKNYRMDGFDFATGCGKPGGGPCAKPVMVYVQQSDVANYWTLAQQYALGDETFQANMGASWTAHQYLIAGQGGGYMPYHYSFGDGSNGIGGTTCRTPDTTYATIDMTTPFPGKAGEPEKDCVPYLTILDELDAAGVSWKYYARSATGYWTSPNAVASLYAVDQDKVIVPETNILDDITNHQLASVSYVTPNSTFSDHPFSSLTNHGQDWIALITNAIGADPYYWNNTVVIVTWDDWGGFFDHVKPPHAFNPAGGDPNPNEYGFRVPFLVIGAYVTPGKVDHTVRSFASGLTFMESVFNLPSLGTLDAQTDDLSGLFNFSQPPNVYQQLPTHGFTAARARYESLHMNGIVDPDTDSR